MKRSEMIQDIATFFLLDDKLDNLNWKEAQQKADNLLTMLEEKGMYPPDNGHCNCGQCWTYEWEKE